MHWIVFFFIYGSNYQFFVAFVGVGNEIVKLNRSIIGTMESYYLSHEPIHFELKETFNNKFSGCHLKRILSQMNNEIKIVMLLCNAISGWWPRRSEEDKQIFLFRVVKLCFFLERWWLCLFVWFFKTSNEKMTDNLIGTGAWCESP